jgi:hypothetical protein
MSRQEEKYKRKRIEDADEIEDQILASFSRSIMQSVHDHSGGSRSQTSEHQTTEEVERPPVEPSPPKHRKYQRRNSFVVIRQMQSPFIFENEISHQTLTVRPLSPLPQKVLQEEPTPSTRTKEARDDLAWANASWSNTDDSKWHNRFPIPCFSKPIIPEHLKQLPSNDQDDVRTQSTVISSPALASLDEKDHNIPDPLKVEVSLSKRAVQKSP